MVPIHINLIGYQVANATLAVIIIRHSGGISEACDKNGDFLLIPSYASSLIY